MDEGRVMRGLVPNWGGGEGSPWQIAGSAPSPVLLATTSFLSGYGIYCVRIHPHGQERKLI